MTKLKLFEIEGEFGYACETVEEFMKFYELDDDMRAEVHEADPDKELSVELESSEYDQWLPHPSRIERTSHGTHRVTAKVRDWLKLYDKPGEVWTVYG